MEFTLRLTQEEYDSIPDGYFMGFRDSPTLSWRKVNLEGNGTIIEFKGYGDMIQAFAVVIVEE